MRAAIGDLADVQPDLAVRGRADRPDLVDGGPGAGGYRQPVSPVDYNGVQHMMGQANNALIFPGLGLGVIAARATRVTDGMLAATARARLDGDVRAAVRHLMCESGYRPVRPG